MNVAGSRVAEDPPPEPDRGILFGAPGALEFWTAFPLFAPAEVGQNFILTLQDEPGLILVPFVQVPVPPNWKLGSERVVVPTTSGNVPLLITA